MQPTEGTPLKGRHARITFSLSRPPSSTDSKRAPLFHHGESHNIGHPRPARRQSQPPAEDHKLADDGPQHGLGDASAATAGHQSPSQSNASRFQSPRASPIVVKSSSLIKKVGSPRKGTILKPHAFSREGSSPVNRAVAPIARASGSLKHVDGQARDRAGSPAPPNHEAEAGVPAVIEPSAPASSLVPPSAPAPAAPSPQPKRAPLHAGFPVYADLSQLPLSDNHSPLRPPHPWVGKVGPPRQVSSPAVSGQDVLGNTQAAHRGEGSASPAPQHPAVSDKAAHPPPIRHSSGSPLRPAHQASSLSAQRPASSLSAQPRQQRSTDGSLATSLLRRHSTPDVSVGTKEQQLQKQQPCRAPTVEQQDRELTGPQRALSTDEAPVAPAQPGTHGLQPAREDPATKLDSAARDKPATAASISAQGTVHSAPLSADAASVAENAGKPGMQQGPLNHDTPAVAQEPHPSASRLPGSPRDDVEEGEQRSRSPCREPSRSLSRGRSRSQASTSRDSSPDRSRSRGRGNANNKSWSRSGSRGEGQRDVSRHRGGRGGGARSRSRSRDHTRGRSQSRSSRSRSRSSSQGRYRYETHLKSRGPGKRVANISREEHRYHQQRTRSSSRDRGGCQGRSWNKQHNSDRSRSRERPHWQHPRRDQGCNKSKSSSAHDRRAPGSLDRQRNRSRSRSRDMAYQPGRGSGSSKGRDQYTGKGRGSERVREEARTRRDWRDERERYRSPLRKHDYSRSRNRSRSRGRGRDWHPTHGKGSSKAYSHSRSRSRDRHRDRGRQRSPVPRRSPSRSLSSGSAHARRDTTAKGHKHSEDRSGPSHAAGSQDHSQERHLSCAEPGTHLLKERAIKRRRRLPDSITWQDEETGGDQLHSSAGPDSSLDRGLDQGTSAADDDRRQASSGRGLLACPRDQHAEAKGERQVAGAEQERRDGGSVQVKASCPPLPAPSPHHDGVQPLPKADEAGGQQSAHQASQEWLCTASREQQQDRQHYKGRRVRCSPPSRQQSSGDAQQTSTTSKPTSSAPLSNGSELGRHSEATQGAHAREASQEPVHQDKHQRHRSPYSRVANSHGQGRAQPEHQPSTKPDPSRAPYQHPNGREHIKQVHQLPPRPPVTAHKPGRQESGARPVGITVWRRNPSDGQTLAAGRSPARREPSQEQPPTRSGASSGPPNLDDSRMPGGSKTGSRTRVEQLTAQSAHGDVGRAEAVARLTMAGHAGQAASPQVHAPEAQQETPQQPSSHARQADESRPSAVKAGIMELEQEPIKVPSPPAQEPAAAAATAAPPGCQDPPCAPGQPPESSKFSSGRVRLRFGAGAANRAGGKPQQAPSPPQGPVGSSSALPLQQLEPAVASQQLPEVVQDPALQQQPPKTTSQVQIQCETLLDQVPEPMVAAQQGSSSQSYAPDFAQSGLAQARMHSCDLQPRARAAQQPPEASGMPAQPQQHDASAGARQPAQGNAEVQAPSQAPSLATTETERVAGQSSRADSMPEPSGGAHLQSLPAAFSEPQQASPSSIVLLPLAAHASAQGAADCTDQRPTPDAEQLPMPGASPPHPAVIELTEADMVPANQQGSQQPAPNPPSSPPAITRCASPAKSSSLLSRKILASSPKKPNALGAGTAPSALSQEALETAAMDASTQLGGGPQGVGHVVDPPPGQSAPHAGPSCAAAVTGPMQILAEPVAPLGNVREPWLQQVPEIVTRQLQAQLQEAAVLQPPAAPTGAEEVGLQHAVSAGHSTGSQPGSRGSAFARKKLAGSGSGRLGSQGDASFPLEGSSAQPSQAPLPVAATHASQPPAHNAPVQRPAPITLEAVRAVRQKQGAVGGRRERHGDDAQAADAPQSVNCNPCMSGPGGQASAEQGSNSESLFEDGMPLSARKSRNGQLAASQEPASPFVRPRQPRGVQGSGARGRGGCKPSGKRARSQSLGEQDSQGQAEEEGTAVLVDSAPRGTPKKANRPEPQKKGTTRLPSQRSEAALDTLGGVPQEGSQGENAWECLWQEKGGKKKKWDGSLVPGTQLGNGVHLYERIPAHPAGGKEYTERKVSKSCHHCQGQTLYLPDQPGCRAGRGESQQQEPGQKQPCGKVFCRRCLDVHFGGMSWEDCQEMCPFCRGVCNCRMCLRKDAPPAGDATLLDGSLRVKAAQRVLDLLGPHAAEWLQREDAVARALGCATVEEATWEDMDNQRVCCDGCATSIPNLHAHCSACDFDMCINCLEPRLRSASLACLNSQCGSRAAAGRRGGGGQSQPKSSKKDTLQCRRFFDDAWMAALRAAAQDGAKWFSASALSCPQPCQHQQGLPARVVALAAPVIQPPSGDHSGHQGSQPHHMQGQGLLAHDNGSQGSHCSLNLPPGVTALTPPHPGWLYLWGTWVPPCDVRLAAARQAPHVAYPPQQGRGACRTSSQGATHQNGVCGSKCGSHYVQLSDGTVLARGRGPGGEDVVYEPEDFLFTPHADTVKSGHERYFTNLQVFMACWEARQPVIVRGVKGRMRWHPSVMKRATRERAGNQDLNLDVLDCRGFTSHKMTQHAFFEGYEQSHTERRLVDEQERPIMYKVKDWPQEEDFKHRLVRHNQDFMEMLPFPQWCHPAQGPLNLATLMPRWSNPTDLGPKTYVAYGQLEEHEGEEWDSVTKLHQDMSDAVNVLVHTQPDPEGGSPDPDERCGACTSSQEASGSQPCAPCSQHRKPRQHQERQGLTPLWEAGPGGAGAVWDIWRAGDVDVLRAYLRGHITSFINKGHRLQSGQVLDPIFDHSVMVGTSHVRTMAVQPQAIQPWRFEQYEHEAVYIPAGCPHQVRNLRPCIKVAVDFVAPEAIKACADMAGRYRKLHPRTGEVPTDSRYSDKLQGQLMLLAAAAQYQTLLAKQAQAAVGEGGSNSSASTTRPTPVLEGSYLHSDGSLLVPEDNKRSKSGRCRPSKAAEQQGSDDEDDGQPQTRTRGGGARRRTDAGGGTSVEPARGGAKGRKRRRRRAGEEDSCNEDEGGDDDYCPSSSE